MITRLQMQGGDPDNVPALNSNQESTKAPQRAGEARDTTTQLLAPISNRQSEEDLQTAARAHNIRARPLKPVPALVKKHMMLLQASNNNQPGVRLASKWPDWRRQRGLQYRCITQFICNLLK